LVDRLVDGVRVDLAGGVAVDGTRNVFDESATVFSRARSSLLLSFRKRASASLEVGRSLRTSCRHAVAARSGFCFRSAGSASPPRETRQLPPTGFTRLQKCK
jgi:hypothetical protein